MTQAITGLHPEHAAEQAYLEKVHLAEEQARAVAQRVPEATIDKISARKAREQMLKRLEDPIDPEALCFGRIDLEGGSTHYLGRGAVRDEQNKLLVINWRMPVAAPFYTATRSDPRGLSRRRRFRLDQLRLLGIVDDAFADSAVRPNPETRAPEPDRAARQPAPEEVVQHPDQAVSPQVEPHVVDAILADMDRARGAEMRDIVATIEAQQYELISDSIEGILAIQGGPGSGKTAIALHRAAWLLFNHRDELERPGVLVVGPNRAFMEYIAQVLPTLGESSVVQSAIDRLVDLDGVRVRGTEAPDVARVKGDLRMASVVQSAVFARVRVPDEDVVVAVDRIRYTVPAGEVSRLVEEAWRRAPIYVRARAVFGRLLVGAVQDKVGRERRLQRYAPSSEDVDAAVTGAGGPFERIWPTVTAPEVIRDLLNSRQRLASATGAELTDDERALLQRDRLRLLREEPWTSADMPLIDEADVALRGITSSYGYVLADEAQDLSPMQLRMVFRRANGGRATLVGDIAQATGPTRFADWDELLDAAAIETQPRIAELAIGYRVPRQIMELAGDLLPKIAPDVLVPRAVRDGPEDPRLVQVDEVTFGEALATEVQARADGNRSVGVVCRSGELDRVRALLSEAGLTPGDLLKDGLALQVTVLSAAQAKGLEFDHVVVVEPAGIAGPDADWAYVYIALTRATRTLSVLYSTSEPFEIPEPEPGPASGGLALEDVAHVTSPPTGTVLGPRYTEALMQAKFLHSGQQRRGTSVPYLAHLQAVASLVLEDGGSEDEAIAGLLHDAVEDNTPEVLDQIAAQFGVKVARIVAGCTDPDEQAGASWRDRKIEHLRALETAGPQVRRVALAEKLDNARALLRDFRRVEERLWTRMDVDPEDLLWYFAALADLFVTERPGDMASELSDTVDRLLDLASTPEPVG